MFLKRLRRDRKGAALVEYALLLSGVALVATAAVSIFGHKTNDMVSALAAVLPGAHDDDNNPILSGKMIETTVDAGSGGLVVDTQAIADNSGNSRLGDNLGVSIDNLVVEVPEAP